MFDSKGRFIIENYHKQVTFSSFLPGISGLYGVPIWCFYVNRGQAIASFGTENKDNSIMEFWSAHQAYQLTRTMGFRTFIKINEEFYEPFHSDEVERRMYIGMNELEIEEHNERLGVHINVLYYTLPGERLGALVRNVTIRNTGPDEQQIEILDGMPAVIPYGIDLSSLKEMAQTMKAWMQVEDVGMKLPFYRTRISIKDSASVSEIEGGNFMFTITQDGEGGSAICDPTLVFEHDTAYEKPIGFLRSSAESLLEKEQLNQNQIPSGFACLSRKIAAGKEFGFTTLIGHAAKKELAWKLKKKAEKQSYFKEKYKEAAALTRDLSDTIWTESANPVFDAYCRQTYVDNVLRGGYPIQVGNDKVFYVYSRKHGDIERDYNYFSMNPEYFSQGNGNFRDVNQNRRSDVRFLNYVKDYNVKLFYNLLQLDGYNPLVIKQLTYKIDNPEPVLACVPEERRREMEKFFKSEFSPGSLFYYLNDREIQCNCSAREFLDIVTRISNEQLNAEFTEGYWTDHWTYNLDLIESYLTVYPENEMALLFEDNTYTYYEAKVVVNPRKARYVKTGRGVRQYDALDEELKANVKHNKVRKAYGKGEIYQSTLMTKLIILAVNKFASLDMYGMGIEMEAGKPGWYDALNGLPGIFGSSMAESYELQRLLGFLKSRLAEYKRNVILPVEMSDFIINIIRVMNRRKNEKKESIWVWNQLNIYKEEYREKTIWGIKGTEAEFQFIELVDFLNTCSAYLNEGIKKACARTNGIPPTYFAYKFDDYETKGKEIWPVGLDIIDMAFFLEGPVRYYKLLSEEKSRRVLYEQIRNTGLFDQKLQMYKVNDSLENQSFEIGRAKAFTAGWLENESIWLHMEYKYLLELLKGGLYDEFFRDLQHAAVPFLSYEQYGRSTLENSSFIASSANKDEKIHGRGFVARLSGSTAEFLEIWQIMMFGKEMFQLIEGTLCCTFSPAIPEYLIPNTKVIKCMLFGITKVFYHFNQKRSIVPGNEKILRIDITYMNGSKEQIHDSIIKGTAARKVRNGKVETINIFF